MGQLKVCVVAIIITARERRRGGEGRRNIRHTERNGRKNVEAQRNGSGEWKAIKNKGNQSRKRLRSVGTETQCEKKNDDPAT